MRYPTVCLVVFCLATLSCASVPGEASAQAQAQAACASAAHRQFDFWLGEWTVMGGPKGDQLQGHNHIERSEDGCRVIEHWRGAGGNHGMSLNAYDAVHQVWRQFWVGGDGLVLRLEGAGTNRRRRW